MATIIPLVSSTKVEMMPSTSVTPRSTKNRSLTSTPPVETRSTRKSPAANLPSSPHEARESAPSTQHEKSHLDGKFAKPAYIVRRFSDKYEERIYQGHNRTRFFCKLTSCRLVPDIQKSFSSKDRMETHLKAKHGGEGLVPYIQKRSKTKTSSDSHVQAIMALQRHEVGIEVDSLEGSWFCKGYVARAKEMTSTRLVASQLKKKGVSPNIVKTPITNKPQASTQAKEMTSTRQMASQLNKKGVSPNIVKTSITNKPQASTQAKEMTSTRQVASQLNKKGVSPNIVKTPITHKPQASTHVDFIDLCTPPGKPTMRDTQASLKVAGVTLEAEHTLVVEENQQSLEIEHTRVVEEKALNHEASSLHELVVHGQPKSSHALVVSPRRSSRLRSK